MCHQAEGLSAFRVKGSRASRKDYRTAGKLPHGEATASTGQSRAVLRFVVCLRSGDTSQSFRGITADRLGTSFGGFAEGLTGAGVYVGAPVPSHARHYPRSETTRILASAVDLQRPRHDVMKRQGCPVRERFFAELESLLRRLMSGASAERIR